MNCSSLFRRLQDNESCRYYYHYLKNPGDFNDPFDTAVLFSSNEIMKRIVDNKERLIKPNANQYIKEVYDERFQEIISASTIDETSLKKYIEEKIIVKQFEWDSLKNLIYVCSFSTKLNDT